MRKLDYNTLEEIQKLVHSSEIEQFNRLEYRLLIVQTCSLLNQHMVRGQTPTITRVMGNEYSRLTQAYNAISRSFDKNTIAVTKETLISSIQTILVLLKKPQYHRGFHTPGNSQVFIDRSI